MKKTTLLCAVALMIAFTAQFAGAQYKMRLAYPNMPAFNNPIEMTNAGDGTNRVFVVQQRGLIYVFPNDPSASARKTFINNTNVSQSGSEMGLLGMAFHPNYETNRYFFLSFTFDSAGGTWSRIARYEASSVNPDTALMSTQQIFLTLRQPYSNHNGGKIAFGPDGYLYISYGDGGSGGDPGNRAQDSTTLLGKILRINIDSAAGGNAYSIPPDNPFVNRPSWKKEIFAYGLRNVWKFNFDYTTGKIWAGDVGQNAWEEIDIIESGKNYGWNKMEGFYCYGTCDTTGKGFTRPIYNYSHSLGISITGGYVYRGAQLPGLYGKYLYADYGAGTLWSLAYDFVNPPTNTTLQDTSWSISSFGEDENKEVYILRYSSTTGFIYKIVNTSVITLDLKMAIEGFYNPSPDRLAIRDTVKVYLHQATAPNIIVDSASAVIDSTTLKGFFIFNNAPTGLYYVRVTSRNGLDTWSKAGGESLQRGVSNSYDFTTAASQAFGSNQKLVGSRYCVFSGDVNSDGAIDGTDNVMIDNDAFAFATGFLVTDLNGDFTIDGTDLIIADNNAFNFVAVIQP
ncbi:MAG: PQQ-dependent sugar dehydrogenase [Ignavibacteria bacterium]|nr:PQQ-dependent sugar dehydrogenase [Ignavibacteria bacterium]